MSKRIPFLANFINLLIINETASEFVRVAVLAQKVGGAVLLTPHSSLIASII
jgi:hypothetical protein